MFGVFRLRAKIKMTPKPSVFLPPWNPREQCPVNVRTMDGQRLIFPLCFPPTGASGPSPQPYGFRLSPEEEMRRQRLRRFDHQWRVQLPDYCPLGSSPEPRFTRKRGTASSVVGLNSPSRGPVGPHTRLHWLALKPAFWVHPHDSTVPRAVTCVLEQPAKQRQVLEAEESRVACWAEKSLRGGTGFS